MFRPGTACAEGQLCHIHGRETEPVDSGLRLPGRSRQLGQTVHPLQDCFQVVLFYHYLYEGFCFLLLIYMIQVFLFLLVDKI